MLFAELHHKLDEDADRLDRREDILTSTVFGTLIVGNRADVIRSWLCRATRTDGTRLELSPDAELGGFWFWPRLHGCEPDLVLRFGQVLVVVEAKYGASKGGAGDADGSDAEGVQDPRDQLVREWNATAPTVDTARFPRDLGEAISGCTRRVVYLVRRQRRAHAEKDLRESVSILGGKEPAHCFFVLTWQDLHRELILLRRDAAVPAPTWIDALAQLLERRELGSFAGIRSDLWPNWTRARRVPTALRTRADLDVPGTMGAVRVEPVRTLLTHLFSERGRSTR